MDAAQEIDRLEALRPDPQSNRAWFLRAAERLKELEGVVRFGIGGGIFCYICQEMYSVVINRAFFRQAQADHEALMNRSRERET
jgi:hypothetical protein